MGETITTLNPGEEHWSSTIVGDNAERAEALKGFDSPDAFLADYESAKNRDWRKEIAGEDDKFLSTLQRFNLPTDLGNSFREAQQKIRSGNLTAKPGDGATDDDIAAWRDANGIPPDPAGYFKNLPEGLVVGEEDMSIFENFASVMHQMNVAPEVMHKTVEWYNSFAEQQQDIRAEMDAEHSAEATKSLREEWGADYRANLNLVQGLVATTFGKDAAEQLLNGRYQDGRAFMNDPVVLQGLAQMARKLNPVMQITPPGEDPMQTLNDEIASIEKYMKEDRTKYNNDNAAQARLRTLYDIRINQAKA